MIFITVGSQKFQFNRLLQKVDKLIETGVIDEEVFAQIGASDYRPVNYKYKDFLSQDEFNDYIKKSDLIVTHAGTGAIVNAVKLEKKVIGIPRLKKYKEHVDDHQLQLIKEFDELNFIEPCYNIDCLDKALKSVKKKKYNKYVSNTKTIINSIRKYIEE